MNELADARLARRDEEVGSPVDVDAFEEVTLTSKRDLRNIVEHDLDPLTRLAHGSGVTHVALDEVDPKLISVRRYQIERAYAVAR